MSLDRQARTVPSLRSVAAAGSVAGGLVACSAAAWTLLSPPGPSLRLIENGGQQAIPVLVMLLAGAILWAFGAAALAVARSRWAAYVASATIGAGAVGITLGAPLVFGRFGVLVIAGAAAVLGGVILVGGGILARGISSPP